MNIQLPLFLLVGSFVVAGLELFQAFQLKKLLGAAATDPSELKLPNGLWVVAVAEAVWLGVCVHALMNWELSTAYQVLCALFVTGMLLGWIAGFVKWQQAAKLSGVKREQAIARLPAATLDLSFSFIVALFCCATAVLIGEVLGAWG